MSSQPILSVRNLTVVFTIRGRKFTAVDRLSFDIERGETLGIVGESGSGKSVSCNALLGLLPRPPAEIGGGEAWFEGSNLLELSEKALRKIRGKRISMVFQDPMTSMNPYIPIGDQVTEPLLLHSRSTGAEAKERAIELLEQVGIHDAARRFDQYPHEFSGGMRQRAMIAMALITAPDILIADEPTSALDATVQSQILDLLKTMQQQHGVSLILVSHDLGVVRRVTDKLVVMDRGVSVEQGETRQVFSAPAHSYTQKLLDAIPHTAKPETYRFLPKDAPVCLRAKGIRVTFSIKHQPFTAVDDVSFQVRRGEVLGIVGESGSGKTTLSQAVLRLVSMDAGEVLLEDVWIHKLRGAALKRHRKQVQMVFQDPYASLNPRMTIHDIIAEPIRLHRLAEGGQAVTAKVISLMQDVGLSPAWANKYPHEFSGGQCQRVAIARAIAVEPILLIADEPVSALDVTIQAQVLNLLLELIRRKGLSMIFISHDLAVVRYMADRVAVMKDGRMIESGETETVYGSPKERYTRELVSLEKIAE